MNKRILLDPAPNDLGAGGGGGGSDASLGTPAGSGNTFLSQLPEDIRSDPSLQSFKDIGSLAKSHVSAQKMLGGRVAIPTDKSTPEEWNTFYGKVGRPEAATGYEIPADIKLPGDLKFSDNLVKSAFEEFHKQGMTKKQAEAAIRIYAVNVSGAYEAQAKMRQDAQSMAEQKLKEEFGDDVSAKLDIAKAVLRRFGDEELLGFLGESGLGNDVRLVKMLSTIGDSLLEDRARGRDSGLQVGDASNALASIGQLKADPTFQAALFNNSAPGHKEAVARWSHLHQVAYPGKQE